MMSKKPKRPQQMEAVAECFGGPHDGQQPPPVWGEPNEWPDTLKMIDKEKNTTDVYRLDLENPRVENGKLVYAYRHVEHCDGY